MSISFSKSNPGVSINLIKASCFKFLLSNGILISFPGILTSYIADLEVTGLSEGLAFAILHPFRILIKVLLPTPGVPTRIMGK